MVKNKQHVLILHFKTLQKSYSLAESMLRISVLGGNMELYRRLVETKGTIKSYEIRSYMKGFASSTININTFMSPMGVVMPDHSGL